MSADLSGAVLWYNLQEFHSMKGMLSCPPCVSPSGGHVVVCGSIEISASKNTILGDDRWSLTPSSPYSFCCHHFILMFKAWLVIRDQPKETKPSCWILWRFHVQFTSNVKSLSDRMHLYGDITWVQKSSSYCLGWTVFVMCLVLSLGLILGFKTYTWKKMPIPLLSIIQ